ncbi:hypothetical protein Cco03nite_78290 [Catellatospora coxensis]|uniref:Uncharacterized protein n=1 Tax=Catellatospora coxensis TaxID=310354 RepID=A0A8J3L491_9ACTN|nr:hypothetical protein Cco03nite_78290 [Catellatospora coxensis]
MIGGIAGPVLFEGLSRALTRALGSRFGDDVGERAVTSLPGTAGLGALTEFSAEQLADLIMNGRIQQSDDPWAPASAGAVEGVVDWVGHRSRRGDASAGLDGDVGKIDMPGWDLDAGGGAGPGGSPVWAMGDGFGGSGTVSGIFVLRGRFGSDGSFDGSVRVAGQFASGGDAVAGEFAGRGWLRGGFAGSFSPARLVAGDGGSLVGEVRARGRFDGLMRLTGTFTPWQAGEAAAPAAPRPDAAAAAGGPGAVRGQTTPSGRVVTGPVVSDAAIVARAVPVPGSPTTAAPTLGQATVAITATSPAESAAVVADGDGSRPGDGPAGAWPDRGDGATEPMTVEPSGPVPQPEPADVPTAADLDRPADGVTPVRRPADPVAEPLTRTDALTAPTGHRADFDERSDDTGDTTTMATPALTTGGSTAESVSEPQPAAVQPPAGRPWSPDAKPAIATLLSSGPKPDPDAMVRSWIHGVEPGRFIADVYTVLTEPQVAVPGPSTRPATGTVADDLTLVPTPDAVRTAPPQPATSTPTPGETRTEEPPEPSDGPSPPVEAATITPDGRLLRALRRLVVLQATESVWELIDRSDGPPELIRLQRIEADLSKASDDDLAFLAFVYDVAQRQQQLENAADTDAAWNSLVELGIQGDGDVLANAIMLWSAHEHARQNVTLEHSDRRVNALSVIEQAKSDGQDRVVALWERGLLPAEPPAGRTDEVPWEAALQLWALASSIVTVAETAGPGWRWWMHDPAAAVLPARVGDVADYLRVGKRTDDADIARLSDAELADLTDAIGEVLTTAGPDESDAGVLAVLSAHDVLLDRAPGPPTEPSEPSEPTDTGDVDLPDLASVTSSEPEAATNPQSVADPRLLRRLRRMVVANATSEVQRYFANLTDEQQPTVTRLRDTLGRLPSADADALALVAFAYERALAHEDARARMEAETRERLNDLFAEDPAQAPGQVSLLWLAHAEAEMSTAMESSPAYVRARRLASEAIEDSRDPVAALRSAGLLPAADTDAFYQSTGVEAVRIWEQARETVGAAALAGPGWRWWIDDPLLAAPPRIADMVRRYLRDGTSIGDSAVAGISAHHLAQVEAAVRQAAAGATPDGLDALVARVLGDFDALLGVGERFPVEVRGEARELEVRVTLAGFELAPTQDGPDDRTLVDTTVLATATQAESKTVGASTVVSGPFNLAFVDGGTAVPVSVRLGGTVRDISHNVTSSHVVQSDQQVRPTHADVGTAGIKVAATFHLRLVRPRSVAHLATRQDGDLLPTLFTRSDVGEQEVPGTSRTVQAEVGLATPEYSLDAGFEPVRRENSPLGEHLPKAITPESAATTHLNALVRSVLPPGLLMIGTDSRRTLLSILRQRHVKASFRQFAEGVRVPSLFDETTKRWFPSFVITATGDTHTDSRQTAAALIRDTLVGFRGLHHDTSANSALAVSVTGGYRVADRAAVAAGVDAGTRRQQRALGGGAGGRMRTVFYMGPSVLRAYDVRWTLSVDGRAEPHVATGTDTVDVRVATDLMRRLPAPIPLAAGHWLLHHPIGDGVLAEISGLEKVRARIRDMMEGSGFSLHGARSAKAANTVRRLVEAQQHHDKVQDLLTEPGVRSFVDSLFDTGIPLTFSRRRRADIERVQIVVKAHRRSGRQDGQSRTVSFQQGGIAVDRAGVELSNSRSLGGHAMAGYAKGLFGTSTTVGLLMRYMYQRLRVIGVSPQRVRVGLTTGDPAPVDGSRVTALAYDLDVDFEIKMTSYFRPRSWVRVVTVGTVIGPNTKVALKRLLNTRSSRPYGRIHTKIDEAGQIARIAVPRAKVKASNKVIRALRKVAIPGAEPATRPTPPTADHSIWLRSEKATVWVDKPWAGVMETITGGSGPGPITVDTGPGLAVPRLPAVPDDRQEAKAAEPARLAPLLPLRIAVPGIAGIGQLGGHALDLVETAGLASMALPGSHVRAQLDAFFSPEFLEAKLPLMMEHGNTTGRMLWSNVFTNDEAELHVTFEPTAFHEPALRELETEDAVIGSYALTNTRSRTHEFAVRLVEAYRHVDDTAGYSSSDNHIGWRHSRTRGEANHRHGGAERNRVEEGPTVVYLVSGDFRLTLTRRTVGAGDIGASTPRSQTWLVHMPRSTVMEMSLIDVLDTNERIKHAAAGPDRPLAELPLPGGLDHHLGSIQINARPAGEGWYAPAYLMPGAHRGNLGPGLAVHIGDTWSVAGDLSRQLARHGVDLLPEDPFQDPMGNVSRLSVVLGRYGIAAFIDSALTAGIPLRLYQRRRLKRTLGLVKQTRGHDVHIELELINVDPDRIVDDHTEHEYIASARRRYTKLWGRRSGIEFTTVTSAGVMPALVNQTPAEIKAKGEADTPVASTGVVPVVNLDSQAESNRGQTQLTNDERWLVPRGPMVKFKGTAQLVVKVPSVSTATGSLTVRSHTFAFEFKIPELDVRASPAPARPIPIGPAAAPRGVGIPLHAAELTLDALQQWQYASGTYRLPDRAAVITYPGTASAEQAVMAAVRTHHDEHRGWWPELLGAHLTDGPRAVAASALSALVMPETSKPQYPNLVAGGEKVSLFGEGPFPIFPVVLQRLVRLTNPRLVRAYKDPKMEAPRWQTAGVTESVSTQTAANAGVGVRSGSYDGVWPHAIPGLPSNIGGSSRTGNAQTHTASRYANVKHKRGLVYVFEFDAQERFVVRPDDDAPVTAGTAVTGRQVDLIDPVLVSVPYRIAESEQWLADEGNQAAAEAWALAADQQGVWAAAALKVREAEHAEKQHDSTHAGSLTGLRADHRRQEEVYLQLKRAAERISDALLAGTWRPAQTHRPGSPGLETIDESSSAEEVAESVDAPVPETQELPQAGVQVQSSEVSGPVLLPSTDQVVVLGAPVPEQELAETLEGGGTVSGSGTADAVGGASDPQARPSDPTRDIPGSVPPNPAAVVPPDDRGTATGGQDPAAAMTLSPPHTAALARFNGALPASGAVHGGLARAVELLPKPGLMLLDEDQRDQRTAAARFRALDSEYVVFAHGGPDGPMVNGRTVTAAQLRDMINDDPRSYGKDIILVQCDAVSPDGDSFADKLFAILPAHHRTLLALAEHACVVTEPDAPAGTLTEVISVRPELDPQGRLHLSATGIHRYTDHPDTSTIEGNRTAQVTQHGARLSRARTHITPRHPNAGGDGLPDDAAAAAARGPLVPTQLIEHVPGVVVFAAPATDPPGLTDTRRAGAVHRRPAETPDTTFRPRPRRYRPSRESAQFADGDGPAANVSMVYREIESQRQSAYEAAAWLTDLARRHGNEPLDTIAKTFRVTRRFQQSLPSYLSPDNVTRLQELSRDLASNRQKLINQAWAFQAELQRRAADLRDDAARVRPLAVDAALGTLSNADRRYFSELVDLAPSTVSSEVGQTIAEISRLDRLGSQQPLTTDQATRREQLRQDLRGRLASDIAHALTAHAEVATRDAAAIPERIDQIVLAGNWENTWRRVSRDVARQVVDRVSDLMLYEPANHYRTGDRYHGAALDRVMSFVRNASYEVPSKEPDPLVDIGRNAFLAMHFGVGTCREYAALAFSLLWNDPRMRGVPLTYVMHQMDHGFVLVGPPGHPNTLVVDAWPWRPTSTTVSHYFLDMSEIGFRFTATPDGRDLLELGRDNVHLHLLPSLPPLRPRPAPLQSFRWDDGYWDTLHSYRDDLGTANSDSEGEGSAESR